jgi:hypothetical protein
MPTGNQAPEIEVQALLDKQAITELSYLYSRACDRLDKELLTSIYWQDATDDHGIFKGTASDYVDWVIDFLEGWISTHHDNTNILIDVDGDKASGEVHWVGYYRFEVEGKAHDNLAVGRYIDRYEKRDGQWRIKHRTCVSDWSRSAPTTNDLRDNLDQSLIGQRGKIDLVYQRNTIGIL